MARLGEAIARYHELLQSPTFRDLAWADELQSDMHKEGLTDSGRLLAPILRPLFLSQEQVARMANVSAALGKIMAQAEALAMTSSQFLNRLGLLPAEKALAALPCGYERPCVASWLETAVHNGRLLVRGFEPFSAVGFAYSDSLANLFLELPIMREFERSGFKVEKLGLADDIVQAIIGAWTEFGGQHHPRVAVLEASKSTGGEAQRIACVFRSVGLEAEAVTPNEFEWDQHKLHVRGTIYDVIFRRLDMREMLIRCELNHPLLMAYRERAVCIVNGFRSEVWQHRAAFEFLTGEDTTTVFSAEDRRLIRQYVPWTRLVSARKTKRDNDLIDLLPFVLSHPHLFALRPNDITSDLPSFNGRELSRSEWDRALRFALRSTYVVQEVSETPSELFPVYRYGQMDVQELAVSVIPHVLGGEMQGASALLQTRPSNRSQIVGIAPVLTIQ